MFEAVGIHVFAGGFTAGVKKVFDVKCQLETHNFGGETCTDVWGVPFINDSEAKWPDYNVQLMYGNPRCTGFSTITSGYDASVHGPWSKPTIDVHQLCKYAVNRADVIVWESVQQAFSVGRPLLDYLRDEIFAPNHYRIAHLFLNAASFGNAQQRKRYFFVAYRDHLNFNIEPPVIDAFAPTVYDAIFHLRERETNCQPLHNVKCEYDFDSHTQFTDDETSCVQHLPNGWNLNTLVEYAPELVPEEYRFVWKTRVSDIPFSLHCLTRLNWLRPHPTIHSSAGRFIHPSNHRGLTIGELATTMGWEGAIPCGPNPIGQIAKGVVPQVGEWLAHQVRLYLTNEWHDEDFESSYNNVTCQWVGRNTHGCLEKTFDLTKYVSSHFDYEREGIDVVQEHRLLMDKRLAQTGR